MNTDRGEGRPGRPSVKAERSRQIVDAFIELVGRQGLDGVTLDAVGRRAGVHRTAIRHHVGNRRALIAAAFTELDRRLGVRAHQALGDAPTIDRLVDYLFSPTYMHASPVDDQAFESLLVEARRDASLAAQIRGSTERMIGLIAALVIEERPDSHPTEARSLAYQVFCLAEANGAFQRLAMEPTMSQDVARTARRLLVGAA